MLSMYEAPAPFWMACCGLCCPYPAAASFDRSAESGLSGMWSSSRSIIVTIISTCASSSVPMARSRSLYLPGSRQFQPCSRYWVATVISPHWPPRTSCILRAKSGSGPSGLASNCRAWVWVNTGVLPRRRRRRRPRGDDDSDAPARCHPRAVRWPLGADVVSADLECGGERVAERSHRGVPTGAGADGGVQPAGGPAGELDEPGRGRPHGPQQVREQGDRVPGLDQVQVQQVVRALEPHVGLEARGAAQ